MQKREVSYTYPNQYGDVTKYQVETYQKEGREPITVFRNSPDNQGQAFGKDWKDRDDLTKTHAEDIKKDFKIDDPSKIEMYQERPDGDFDRVKFSHRANEQGKLVWGEESREKCSQKQLDERLSDYEHGLNKENQMTLAHANRNQFLENKEEISQFKDKVENSPNENTKNSQQQDEVSRGKEIRREQEITR